jgi:hypothetical protein
MLPPEKPPSSCGDNIPSLMALAEDVSLAGLSLGIEGVEGLLQPLFG